VKKTLAALRLSVLGALAAPLVLFAPGMGVSQSGSPAPTNPAIRVVEAPQVTVSAGQTFFASAPARAQESTINPLLRSAARRLNNDPDRIYEFVYNAIQVEPMFGLQKGAVGAYVNRSGTPFDQAELMVKLARAAGYSARYRYGPITLTGTQFQAWMGTNNAAAARRILQDGGFPNDVVGTTTVTSATFLSVWPEVQIGGTWYQFNPAVKSHVWYSPADFKTLMGYDRTAMRTATGSLVTAGTVPQYTGTTGGQLSTLLTTKATTLATALSGSTYSQLAPEEVLGGSRITQISRTAQRLTSLPEAQGGSATWTGEVPNPFRVQITATAWSASGTPTATSQYGDEYYAKRYRISPDPVTDYIGLPTGEHNGKVSIALNHPYPANTGAYADQTYTVLNQATHAESGGEPELLPDGSIWLTQLQITLGHEDGRSVELITRQTANTEPCPIDVSTIGGEYNPYPYRCAIPHNPVLQRVARAQSLIEGLGSASVASHHALAAIYSGRTREKWDGSAPGMPGGSGTKYLSVGSVAVLSIQSELSVASLNGVAADRSAAIGGHATLFAAAETGEMLQSYYRNTPQDMTAAYQAGNSGNRYLWITSANLSSALSTLTSWSTLSKTRLQEYVTAGYIVVAPKHGDLGADFQPYMRSGVFWAFDTSGNVASVYVERGGVALKGAGVSGGEVKPPGLSRQFADEYNRGIFNPAGAISVDKQTGLRTFTPPTLLSTGSGSFPARLDFKVKIVGEPTRASHGTGAVSNAWGYGAGYPDDGQSPRLFRGQLGYTIYTSLEHDLSLGEDFDLALGGRSAAEASSAVVAAVATMEEFRAGQDTLSAMLAWGAQAWLGKQMQDGSATIVHGVDGIGKFFRMPDGTWRAPGDSLETLVQTGTSSFAAPYNRRALKDISFVWRGRDGALKSFGQQNPPMSCWPSSQIPPPVAYGIGRAFGMNTWTLPGGEYVTAVYDNLSNCSANPILRRLENNYGRHLEFDPTSDPPALSYEDFPYIRDDQGRTVRRINTGMSPVEAFWAPALWVGLSGSEWQAARPDAYQIGFAMPEKQKLWLEAEGCVRGHRNLIGYHPIYAVNYEDLPRAYCETLKLFFNDPNAPVQTVTMDMDDEGVKSIADGDGVTVNYAVMPGYRYATTNATNHTFSEQYDDKVRLKESLSPEGRLKTYAFDGRGRLLDEKLFMASDPTVNYDWVSYVYDNDGRQIEKHVHPWMDPATHLPYGGASPLVSKTFWNTTWNKPSIERNALNKDTTYTYDPTKGLLTQVDGPTGERTNYEYDSLGRLFRTKVRVSASPLIERVTEQTYDAKGNLATTVVDPSGLAQTTTWGYDLVGNLTSAQNPRGHTTTASYDNLRRLTAVNGAINAQVVLFYGGNGMVSRTEQKTLDASKPAVTTWDYLPSGRLKTIVDPEGASTVYTYNGNGQLRYIDDPVGRRTEYGYLPDGLQNVTISGVGGSATKTTSMVFYPDGSPRFYYDGLKAVTGQDFGTVESLRDAWGREAGNRYGDGSKYEIKTLNAAGSQTQLRVRDKAPVSGGVDRYFAFTYDDSGKQISKTVPTTTATKNLRTDFSYNLAGEVLSATYTDERVSGVTQRVEYVYEAATGRVSSETWWKIYGTTTGLTTGFTFDANGNRTSIIWPDAYAATYQYDAEDRLIQVGWTRPGGASGVFATYVPTPQGGLRNAIYGNGATLTADRKASGDLYRAVHTWPGNAQLTTTYGRNGSHQINYHLPSLSYFRYAPPTAATMVYGSSTGQAVNLFNEYETVTINGTPLAVDYDDRGNMTTDGTRLYEYDFENQMERVTTIPGIEIVRYGYDPTGRRSSKALTGGAETLFLHAGSTEIADIDSATGAVQRRYVPGDGQDVWVAYVDEMSAGAIKYVHQDGSGSLFALSDAGGVIAATDRYTYDPYGKPGTGAATGFPFRYTGQRYDNETGLYYYKARYYNSLHGRFMQNDPIGVEGALNFYDYVSSDPLNKADPTGLYECTGQGAECADFEERLQLVRDAAAALPAGSDGQKDLQEVVDFYGAAGVDNDVNVGFSDFSADTIVGNDGAAMTSVRDAATGETNIGVDRVKFAEDSAHKTGQAEQIAHEGRHGVDLAKGPVPQTRDAVYQYERSAALTQSYVAQGLRVQSANTSAGPGTMRLFDPSWAPGVRETNRSLAAAQRASIAATKFCANYGC
jgi:RHS repeat-associated protein